MNEFIRMFLRMFIQVGPYLVVFVVLGYIIKLQEKKAKEREEEQKKGIIKTHYVVKTEKTRNNVCCRYNILCLLYGYGNSTTRRYICCMCIWLLFFSWHSWYSKYDVIEVKNDRIVIGIGNTVTAAVNAANLAAA